MAGPLSGVRIVEAASVITGPWACSLLADQGAEVIKIEAPSGDIMRASGHLRAGVGSWFVNLNRGKRSLVLDLGQPEGLEIARSLVADADVFVQNWRPGVADRLGLGYEALSTDHPDLVYLSISGFGDVGPLAAARAYDPTVQGRSGIVAAQSSDRVDCPEPVRLAISDQVTSLTAAQAVTAALLARAEGSGGQHIELSMLEASIQFLWPIAMSDHTYVGDDVTPGVMYGPTLRYWPTVDGAVTAAIAPDKEWGSLCSVAGRDDWREDPRFVDIMSRLVHYDELMSMVGEHIATLTTEQAARLFDAADVPFAPAVPRDGLWDDPQVAALELIEEVDHTTLGTIRRVRPATRFSGTPSASGAGAPLLGEHTDAVLHELGHDASSIAMLRERGVVS